MSSNWIMTELMGVLNETNIELSGCRVSADNLGALIAAIKDGTISGRIAKDVFREMFDTGKTARDIIKEKNLVQVSDTGLIEAAVDKAIADNPGPAADFRAGKEKAIGFLVGQIMKATKGKANPQLVNELLRKKLEHG